MKRRTFTAAFSDGATATRVSTRPYTHAFSFTYIRKEDGLTFRRIGFSTSAEQCARNMHSEAAWFQKPHLRGNYEVTFLPVVAVDVKP